MPAQALVAHTYSVSGVHCSQCLKKLKGLKEQVPGLSEVVIDMSQQKLRVLAGAKFDSEEFIRATWGLGFKAKELKQIEGQESKSVSSRALLARVGVSGALTGNIMLLSYAIYLGAPLKYGEAFAWLCGFLYLPLVFYSAVPFYQSSLQALIQKKVSIDLPLTLAILVGSFLSYFNLLRGSQEIYFDSLAALIFLILSSRYLVYQFQKKHLSPISLQDIFPNDNYLRVDDKIEKKVKANEIQVGDQLILYKNQTVPADGILLSQQAFFDNSLITGESDSVEQVVSSKVYGGARCLSDKIFIEVTSDQSESRMSHILDQLDVALNRDSSITELTDSVAHYFTYGLFTTGLIFFTTYSFVDFDEAINRVLALFVIACPCALAVTTPIVLRLAAKKSFKHNFLIKRADVFEKLNQCQAVVFDKTGTLTYSQSEVLAWTPRRPSAFEEQIIYSLEQNSSHPLANAIIASLEGTQIKPLSLKNFAETAGLGVEGFYKGDCYSLRSYDHEHGDVGFFKNNQLTLSIRTQTHIRSEVTEEVQQLQGMNLDVYLLTGDNIEKAINLANQAGIHKKNIIAGIDPEGKSDFIKKLSQHKAVVYVGDGLNDSLAMAQGLVGISMNQSVEATFAASSIHILKDGVSGIGKLLKQGKFTLKTIRSLLLISFIYNITFGVLALTGFVTPLLASILMPINSLALLSFAVARGRRL